MRAPEAINKLDPHDELSPIEGAAYLMWLMGRHEEHRRLRDELAAASEDWERVEIWMRIDELAEQLKRSDA